jgi:GPH family glycoside/pentoside/hexuronide:cation symporter
MKEKEQRRLSDRLLFKTRVTSANVKAPEVIFGYLLGPFSAMISNAVFGSYLDKYLSDVIGWTDTSRFGLLSVILPLVSVLLIVVGNVAVGWLIDRTRTSQGKARPYLLLSAPFVGLAIFLLLAVPREGNDVLTIIWICLSYNLYYAFSYPLYFASHSSLVALATRHPKQRNLLSTASNASGVMAVGLGANILVPLLLQDALFVKKNGTLDPAASYANWRIFMIVLVILTIVGILVEYAFTRERITEENVKLSIKESKRPAKEQARGCLSSKDWWLLMLFFLLFQFGGLVKNSSMAYFADWVLNGSLTGGTAMGLLGLLGGIPTAIGMVVAAPLTDRIGKKNAIAGGLALSVLGGLVSFINVHDFWIVALGVMLKGIGSIPAMYVSLSLLSDVLDHLEAKNGFRSDGFTFAVYGAIMVGLAPLSLAFINALLTGFGYDPTLSAQTTATQNAIAFCFLGLELICYAILAIALLFVKAEKGLEADHQLILARQKETVLAQGGVWLEPEERLRKEQEEADRLSEEARREELRARCAKKGLSFEEEEAKYEARKRKRAERSERLRNLFKGKKRSG